MSEELRAEPAPRFRCVCGTEDMVTRERDGTLIDKMRCPGCDRSDADLFEGVVRR